MAKTKVRRVIRKVKPARAEPFDEQLWPIQLTLLILGGFLVGMILAYLRPNDLRWWANAMTWLIVTPLAIGALMVAARFVDRRWMRRAVQLSLALCLLIHLVLGVVMFESTIFRRVFPENREVANATHTRVVVPDYHHLHHPQQRRPQDFLMPVETETPEPETHEELQQEQVERPRPVEQAPPQPQPVPEPEQTVRPAEVEQRRPSETAPRMSEQQSQMSRQTTQTAPQPIAQAVTAPSLSRPAPQQQSAPTPNSPSVARQTSESQAQRQPVNLEPTTPREQPRVELARRETQRSPVPETTAAPTLPRQAAEPQVVPRTQVEPAPQVASAQQTSPQAPQPNRVTLTRQTMTPTTATATPTEAPEAPAQRATQVQRRQVDSPAAPAVVQAPAPNPQQRTTTQTRPEMAVAAETPAPSRTPQPAPAPPNIAPQTAPLERRATESVAQRSTSIEAPAAEPSPASSPTAPTQLARREMQPAPTTAQTRASAVAPHRAAAPSPAPQAVAAAAAPAGAPAASNAPAAVRPSTTAIARQAAVGPSVSQNPIALEAPAQSPADTAARSSPNRAQTAAVPSANPQATPTASPARSSRIAAVAASPTPVESPALAEASPTSNPPALQPAQLALSRAEMGTAGIGASVNLDTAGPTDAGASAVASAAATRATARSANAGPELSPSAPAQVARANAGDAAPSATMQADHVPIPNTLGADQPSEINASSSAALTRADSDAEASPVSAAAGNVEVDIGPTRVVATEGASRAAGGGQPELNAEQQSRLPARSASSGAPALALATPTTADVVAAPAGTGGGDPPRPDPQLDAVAAVAANSDGGEPITGGPSMAVEAGPPEETSGATSISSAQVARAETVESPPGVAGGREGAAGSAPSQAQLARATSGSPETTATAADLATGAPGGDSGLPAGEEDEEEERLAALAALQGQAGPTNLADSSPASSRPGAAQSGPPSEPSHAVLSGASQIARAEAVAAAPGALEAGGGSLARTRSSAGPQISAALQGDAPVLAGAPASSGQPDTNPLASAAGALRAPLAGGVLAQTAVGPTGALEGPETIDAPREGVPGAQVGRRAASDATANGPLLADPGNTGSPGRRATEVALAGGLLAEAAPLAPGGASVGTGDTPDMAAVAGNLDETGEMDMSQLAFEAAGGARPVNVAAPDGPGGVGPMLTSDVGAGRRGAPDADVVHFRDARFVRREVGGTPAVNLTAVAPAEAFAQRLQPKEQGDRTGGGGPPPLTEEAIERGLAFLARHQMPDGSWSFGNFGRGQRGYESETAALESDTAATGLALLAFQGGGYSHQHGKYQDTVRKALDYLMRKQKADGDLYVRTGGPSDAAMWIYSHGVASLAMCEAYGMTQDPALREPTQRALNFIVAGQNKTRGGWRYSPNYGSDTSVTGWMMMALKSGELAGLDVPSETFRNVEKWLDAAQKSPTERHLYVYNPLAPDTPQQRHGRLPNPTMTAVGLLMRLYTGWSRDNPHLATGSEYLLANPPAIGTRRDPHRDTYYWYYATQVLFHMGGDYWKAWNSQLHPLLIDSQEKTGPMAGSWNPRTPVPDRWGPHCGRIYVTTLNLLSLEVYYRHLPLYVETGK